MKRVLCAVSLAAVTAVGGATAALPAARCTAGPHALQAGPYSVSLSVGPMEKMLTPAEAKRTHATKGEVMVGGDMTPMAGSMKMGGAICTTATTSS